MRKSRRPFKRDWVHFACVTAAFAMYVGAAFLVAYLFSHIP